MSINSVFFFFFSLTPNNKNLSLMYTLVYTWFLVQGSQGSKLTNSHKVKTEVWWFKHENFFHLICIFIKNEKKRRELLSMVRNYKKFYWQNDYSCGLRTKLVDCYWWVQFSLGVPILYGLLPNEAKLCKSLHRYCKYITN